MFQATLSLLERVLMKDVVTPVAPEEVRAMIQTSLENAALLNYTQLSQKANIEGKHIVNIEHHVKNRSPDNEHCKKTQKKSLLVKLNNIRSVSVYSM